MFPGQLGGGGYCPSLPANRDPSLDSSNPINEGWELVSNPYNDDGSSGPVTLPFTFDIFGALYTEVYINNNGNLSFGSSLSTFTSSGFPFSGTRLVAPFWADVDTRTNNGDIGRVWQWSSGSTFAVAWDHVGYYNTQGDKRNTFMVMISDGNNPNMGIGNTVCFCYEDMEWTTGSASGGVNGFGGTPATVGINEGSGDLGYFQIGRYDEAGQDSLAGIDNLDGQSYCFYASGENFPPIVSGAPENDTVELVCDQSMDDLVITFAAPEGNDVVTLTHIVFGDQPAGLTVDIQDETQTAVATISWTSPSIAQTVSLEFLATDSFGDQVVLPLMISSAGPCKTGQDHLNDALNSLHTYLKAASFWRDYHNYMKAYWAKVKIYWALKDIPIEHKIWKAEKASGYLGCQPELSESSPFFVACDQITMALSSLEAESTL